VECQKERRLVVKILDTIDSTVIAGYTALALEKEQDVGGKIAAALELLVDLERLLKAAGVLK